MTTEEIRKNAPEGATHYRQFSSSVRYVKYTGDVDYFWTSSGWIEFSVKQLPLDIVKKTQATLISGFFLFVLSIKLI